MTLEVFVVKIKRFQWSDGYKLIIVCQCKKLYIDSDYELNTIERRSLLGVLWYSFLAYIIGSDLLIV